MVANGNEQRTRTETQTSAVRQQTVETTDSREIHLKHEDPVQKETETRLHSELSLVTFDPE